MRTRYQSSHYLKWTTTEGCLNAGIWLSNVGPKSCLLWKTEEISTFYPISISNAPVSQLPDLQGHTFFLLVLLQLPKTLL